MQAYSHGILEPRRIDATKLPPKCERGERLRSREGNKMPIKSRQIVLAK
jgi:hypothetical protein